MVGAASRDRLRLATGTCDAPGGAGLYTALAVAAAGGRAVLLAPRPLPTPPELQPVAERIEWIGPEVSPEALPRLEIAHHGGGRATLVDATWGAVAALDDTHLPDWTPDAAAAHVAALPGARQQLRFAEAIRARSTCLLSAGTYARAIQEDAAGVRRLFESVDVFFLNENEAGLLFGGIERVPAGPRPLVFVTRGDRGARVLGGGASGDVEAVAAEERDPTGAGDCFCGAALAALVAGRDPLEAARAGARLAARAIGGVGPAALLGAAPRS